MPISFTDAQLETVRTIAAQLPPWRRSAFLRQLAEALHGKADLGDGELPHGAGFRPLSRGGFPP
jgi:hypothetical protein